MKNILIEAGYDIEASLLQLDNENISGIESYVQQNRSIIAGTIYENIDPFHFKPGHKSVLLSIPKKINDLKLKEKPKNTKVKEQSETNSGNNKTLDEAEIEQQKQQLIVKLKKFCDKIQICLELKIDDISDFVVLDDRIKCRVACPYCSSKFSCIKIAHWAVSNIESHLKKHKIALAAISNENRPHNNITPTVQSEINEMLDS